MAALAVLAVVDEVTLAAPEVLLIHLKALTRHPQMVRAITVALVRAMRGHMPRVAAVEQGSEGMRPHRATLIYPALVAMA